MCTQLAATLAIKQTPLRQTSARLQQEDEGPLVKGATSACETNKCLHQGLMEAARSLVERWPGAVAGPDRIGVGRGGERFSQLEEFVGGDVRENFRHFRHKIHRQLSFNNSRPRRLTSQHCARKATKGKDQLRLGRPTGGVASDAVEKQNFSSQEFGTTSQSYNRG